MNLFGIDISALFADPFTRYVIIGGVVLILLIAIFGTKGLRR